MKKRLSLKSKGFTIVELLVVIVIIGILSALVIVSYNGINQKAIIATLQADLSSNAKQLKLYKVEYGSYPTGLDGSNCPSAPNTDSKYCIRLSSGNSVDSYTGTTDSFLLVIKNGTLKYQISESSQPIVFTIPPVTFAKAYGGAASDTASQIIKTSDGGYASTGSTSSYGPGIASVFLSKYTYNGTLSWTKVYGSGGQDSATSLIQTNDGGFVIAGSYGSDTFNAFISKFDSNGNLSWSKSWSNGTDSYGSSVAQTSDGGYVMSISCDQDVVILKYTSGGNLSWSKRVPGSYYESGRLFVQSDGSIIVGGSTQSYGASPGNTPDIYIMKLSSDGNIVWFKTWGGSATDYGNSITMTSDGGFILAGDTYSFGAGSEDGVILKYSSDGTLSWAKVVGGSGYEHLSSVEQLNDGSYLVSGLTDSFGAGSYDVFLVKLASDGTINWTKTWGNTASDQAASIRSTDDGGFTVFASTTSYGLGGFELLIAKYNSSGSIIGCSSPLCQNVSPTVSSPTGTITTPSITLNSDSVITSNFSPSGSNPNMTTTTIVPVQ